MMFLAIVSVIASVVGGMIYAAAKKDGSDEEKIWQVEMLAPMPRPAPLYPPEEKTPDTDYGVDEKGYEKLDALNAVPPEVGNLAIADPLGYEIAASLWEWERMSVDGFTARVNDALIRFEAGLPMRVQVGANYPEVDEVTIAEDLPRWHHDLAHTVRDVERLFEED